MQAQLLPSTYLIKQQGDGNYLATIINYCRLFFTATFTNWRARLHVMRGQLGECLINEMKNWCLAKELTRKKRRRVKELKKDDEEVEKEEEVKDKRHDETRLKLR